MIIAALLIGGLFILFAFIISEKNAFKYLSVFNSLSQNDRKLFDLPSFIRFFRRFHLFLGISYILFSLLLFRMMKENVAGIFMAVYPLLAYLFFLSYGQKYSKNTAASRYNRIGIFVLIFSLLFIFFIFFSGFRDSGLLIKEDRLNIEGIYKTEIKYSDLQSIELIDQLPAIKHRRNGIALGSVNKGWFTTRDGQNVKLILNSGQCPIIRIKTISGEIIFFSSAKEDNSLIFNELEASVDRYKTE